jgi:hypothetical protein
LGPQRTALRLSGRNDAIRSSARHRSAGVGRQEAAAGGKPRRRWWFATENRRVRQLYLPLGGRRFRSRHAYRLVNASQQEALCERARRRERKLRRRLGGFGGDPMDIPYPEKPRLMRWATYNRLLDKLMAAWRVAERAADERIFAFLARRGAWPP